MNHEHRLHPPNPKGVSKTPEEDGGPKKVKRVRKVTTVPSREGREGTGPARVPEVRAPEGDQREGPEEDEDYLRFISVLPVAAEGRAPAAVDPLHQQVLELFTDFQMNVAHNEESFRQYMYWADESDGVSLEDLLIATKSIYDKMDTPLPCTRATWNEIVESANLVEVSSVSDSELEYALEVFSKAYDLYRADLQRLDEERTRAEQLSSQRISDEILAEGAEEAGTEDLPAQAVERLTPAELERWDKVVDDVRSKINSTKAEFDELIEELAPSKLEREAALSRLRVLEKDANRKQNRLDRYQSGRISEAKAEEIQNIERELAHIEDEQADWESRLSIAQERIDQRIGLCAQKRSEFLHIQGEVNSLLDSLSQRDRAAVSDALTGELQDLDEVLEDLDQWLGEITSTEGETGLDSAAIIDSPHAAGEAAITRTGSISSAVVRRMGEGSAATTDEPPVVFMDAEVRRMLAELPIERPPEEELLLRIDTLQKELLARENNILEMEHSIERLMEDREGTTTAVELERNKIRLELNKVQEELAEKQGLLEQYLDVIRALEAQMEMKDRELRETLALNRRKTDELRQKEDMLQNLERELLEKQEEFRQERQELQDRESRLNTQVTQREGQERELAKKDLTLELRNEQIRKKMDRLTAKELELQRVSSQQKEMEEMLTLKERELQNLKTELDVREDEMRRRDSALEEHQTEVKKLQSEVSKLEHRVRSRDETLRRREAHVEEEEERIRHHEASIAEREVQIHDREEEVALREAKVETAQGSLDTQREQVDTARRELSRERQEVERLRIAQEHRHEELMRREDQMGVREDTLRERERALQLREERLELERAEVHEMREEFTDIEVKWSAKEKNLLERLGSFNSEKEELMEDWKGARTRIRELERDKADLTARLIAAESSLMNKDGEILAVARELEEAQGREHGASVELEAGVRTSLSRIMEDVQRQREELKALDTRSARVEARERELIEMEEILNNERERVRELLSEQERGRVDLQEALEHLASKTSLVDGTEALMKDREVALVSREQELARREEEVRRRERDMERLTTAEDAVARAEDREEELMTLQRQVEDRTAALEAREEELEGAQAGMRSQEVELERQKAELMLGRENLLRARAGEEELVELPKARTPAGQDNGDAYHRAPAGLAVKAAEFAALSREEVREVEAAERAVARQMGQEERKPLARLRCKVCSTVIPIYTSERPLEIICPGCGKGGILK